MTMIGEPGVGEPPPVSADRPDLSGPSPAADFEELFGLHAADLHRYLSRSVGIAADDLVADTFVAALKNRHTYDRRLATARAWLFGIATNLLHTHLRTRGRERAATGRLAARVSPTAEGPEVRVVDRIDAEQRARLLADALLQLAPGDRDVLLLSSWAGLDTNEVAAALRIPVGTVRSRLHRVRRQLRIAAGGTEQ